MVIHPVGVSPKTKNANLAVELEEKSGIDSDFKAIYPIFVEIFQSGPKWWTNHQTVIVIH